MGMMQSLVERYKQCMEELQDAQKYLRLARKNWNDEERDMFLSLADQEIGHYEVLRRSGENMLKRGSDSSTTDDLSAFREAWDALMSTSSQWANEIKENIAKVRSAPRKMTEG